MAVTRDGVPVRCWTFPGDTADTAIIRTVKDDLGGWGLRRLVWVADRGFASAANRAYLTRGGGHYIHAEKLRHTNTEAAAALARPGPLPHRGRQPAGQGGRGGPRRGRRRRRGRPHPAVRDLPQPRAGRPRPAGPRQPGRPPAPADRRLRRLDRAGAATSSSASLKAKPGLRRYLRRTPTGLLRIDHAAIKRETHLDGKWLLRTSDLTLTPDDLAAAYKQLLAVERGWRDFKGALGLRPVFHHREDRIRAHVQLCWLALLLIRVIENATGDTWRNVRHELDRMHLVTLATNAGQVAQRTTTTPGQQTLLRALDLPEPPRFFDFTLPEQQLNPRLTDQPL